MKKESIIQILKLVLFFLVIYLGGNFILSAVFDKPSKITSPELSATESNTHSVTSTINNRFKRYQKACNAGCGPSCSNIASMYRQGIGNKEDYINSSKLYKKVCDSGNAKGCYSLANVHHYGIGISQKQHGMEVAKKIINIVQKKKDVSLDNKLYQKSCDGGYMPGCYAMGFYYMHRGNDEQKGVSLYEKACNGGNRDACESLGVLYGGGYSTVEQDGFKAKELYQRASKLVMPCSDTDEINFARIKR